LFAGRGEGTRVAALERHLSRVHADVGTGERTVDHSCGDQLVVGAGDRVREPVRIGQRERLGAPVGVEDRPSGRLLAKISHAEEAKLAAGRLYQQGLASQRDVVGQAGPGVRPGVLDALLSHGGARRELLWWWPASSDLGPRWLCPGRWRGLDDRRYGPGGCRLARRDGPRE
jgi:hypothetical protein